MGLYWNCRCSSGHIILFRGICYFSQEEESSLIPSEIEVERYQMGARLGPNEICRVSIPGPITYVGAIVRLLA